MSPEQALARRGVVNQRTDIYALGVTLYELLTLRPAFDGQRPPRAPPPGRIRRTHFPARLNPAIPRDLETIVLQGDGQGSPAPVRDGPGAGQLTSDASSATSRSWPGGQGCWNAP